MVSANLEVLCVGSLQSLELDVAGWSGRTLSDELEYPCRQSEWAFGMFLRSGHAIPFWLGMNWISKSQDDLSRASGF